jgi:hypothetical protein
VSSGAAVEEEPWELVGRAGVDIVWACYVVMVGLGFMVCSRARDRPFFAVSLSLNPRV